MQLRANGGEIQIYSEILQVGFQTAAIKQILQLSKSHEFWGSSSYKVMFAYHGLLSVR